jgi:DNA-binding NtrC family response regulator
MKARELLFLKPDTTPPGVVPALRAAGWTVHEARSQRQAREILGARPIHVGLAHFGASHDHLPREFEDLVDTDTKWVAMLEPRQLGSREVSNLIHERFFDYHTLPADLERLLHSLGHAYGMAHVAAPEKRTSRIVTLAQARDEAERKAIEHSLRRQRGKITHAARELGVTRVTLYRLLDKHGLSAKYVIPRDASGRLVRPHEDSAVVR